MAIKDFVYDSDYLMDYIVWKYEGSINISETITDYRIPHGLPFTPLLVGVMSETPDFAESYNIGVGLYNYSTIFTTLSSDSTNAIITAGFATPRTIYVRLLGFRNPGYDGNVEAVQLREDFRKNTDFNYPKIFMSGVSKEQNPTIYHNLGYIPQVRVWCNYHDQTRNALVQSWYVEQDDGQIIGAEITPQYLKLHSSNVEGAPFYYFIFGDNGTW